VKSLLEKEIKILDEECVDEKLKAENEDESRTNLFGYPTMKKDLKKPVYERSPLFIPYIDIARLGAKKNC
jgi:hypothetical protein